MSKVVPIKGYHETIKSLLAEVMNDESLESIIIYGITKQGALKPAHIGATAADYSVVAIHAMSIAQESMFDSVEEE